MTELTFAPNRTMSEQFHSLSGLGWNVVLLLFSGAWLSGVVYTLYGMFVNFGDMSFLWFAFSIALLAAFGSIATFGTVVAVMGIYAYTKSLISDTDASYG